MRGEFTRYSFKDPRNNRRRLIVATLIVLCVIAMDIATGGLFRSGVRAVMAPILHAANSVYGATLGSGFFSRNSSLQEENVQLREALAAEKERNLSRKALEDENMFLRSMVHLAETENGETVRVLSSPRASVYGTFLVEASEEISVGDIVMTPGGFVIGTIVERSGSAALVKALFAAGNTLDIVVGGVAAPAEGRGGNNARADIPRSAEVQEDDAVTAPSVRGLPVGIVGHIESDPSLAEKTLDIVLPTNLDTLRFVYVVRGI